jgi:hypothetical protein
MCRTSQYAYLLAGGGLLLLGGDSDELGISDGGFECVTVGAGVGGPALVDCSPPPPPAGSGCCLAPLLGCCGSRPEDGVGVDDALGWTLSALDGVVSWLDGDIEDSEVEVLCESCT